MIKPNTIVIPVFAYGTLKKGFGNAARCIESGPHEYIGPALTVDKYLMQNEGIAFVSRRQTPGLEKAPPFEGRITGDLWLVDDAGLARCDALEGHPDNYCRDLVKVTVGDDVHSAWLYFYPSAVRRARFEIPDPDGNITWHDARPRLIAVRK